MQKAYIGGFFELELPVGPSIPHNRARGALASGRVCLATIMRELQPTKVWVPFYICDSVLHALALAEVSYAFYGLTEELELSILPELAEKEYLLYVNYFGLKSEYIRIIFDIYEKKLLLDLTQAFFEEPNPGQWAFNSARKFFGVPDGAYLYTPENTYLAEFPENKEISLEHLVCRQLGQQEAAYTAYNQYEGQMSYAPASMSAVTRSWLSWLDYPVIARKRQDNFKQYHELLQPLFNDYDGIAREWLPLPFGAVPFCYPLRLVLPLPNRQSLFEQQIFLPWLWPEMRHRSGDFPLEKSFVDGVLILPLDHRYGPEEVRFVVQAVSKMIKMQISGYI